MPDRKYNVLFLCTGNSARSVIAECLLNRHGGGKFTGYSAGSQPTGEIHPLTYWILQQYNYPTDELRSKNWSEFSGPGAPVMDIIFTVCDSAAAESCPVWPGHPLTAHWRIPDPAAVDGPGQQQRAAFRDAYGELEKRVSTLVNLPLDSLDPRQLKRLLDEIGRSGQTER